MKVGIDEMYKTLGNNKILDNCDFRKQREASPALQAYLTFDSSKLTLCYCSQGEPLKFLQFCAISVLEVFWLCYRRSQSTLLRFLHNSPLEQKTFFELIK